MSEQDNKVVVRVNRKSKFVLFAVAGVIAFITIYFPFFGSSIDFQVGLSLNNMMEGVGRFLTALGALYFLIGFIGLIQSGRNSYRSLMVGFILMWLGAFLVSPGIGIDPTKGTNFPRGYH